MHDFRFLDYLENSGFGHYNGCQGMVMSRGGWDYSLVEGVEYRGLLVVENLRGVTEEGYFLLLFTNLLGDFQGDGVFLKVEDAFCVFPIGLP